jgi:hypothetical protein
MNLFIKKEESDIPIEKDDIRLRNNQEYQ